MSEGAMAVARLITILELLSLLCACANKDTSAKDDSAQLTAILVSPNGAEGAAYLTLVGAGVKKVSAVDSQIYSNAIADTTHIVLVRNQPGELRFLLELERGGQRPSASVVEVADGENRLRSDLSRYRLELIP